jgi:hypothetical protein
MALEFGSRVLENKSGLRTYKRHQGPSYSLCSSSNYSFEKSYDGYLVPPIIVAGGLLNLVMLSMIAELNRTRKDSTTEVKKAEGLSVALSRCSGIQ